MFSTMVSHAVALYNSCKTNERVSSRWANGMFVAPDESEGFLKKKGEPD